MTIPFDPVGAIFSGINSIKTIINENAEQEAVLMEFLEELSYNFKLINNDYLKNNLPVEDVIPVLKISALEKAERARKRNKIEFNQLKKGKINKGFLVTYHQKRHYKDYDTERLMLKLREKLIHLKTTRKLYYKRNKWNKKINQKRRMNSLVNLIILISNHISE